MRSTSSSSSTALISLACSSYPPYTVCTSAAPSSHVAFFFSGSSVAARPPHPAASTASPSPPPPPPSPSPLSASASASASAYSSGSSWSYSGRSSPCSWRMAVSRAACRRRPSQCVWVALRSSASSPSEGVARLPPPSPPPLSGLVRLRARRISPTASSLVPRVPGRRPSKVREGSSELVGSTPVGR